MKKNILMRSMFVLSATALSAFGIYSLVNKVGTAQAATPCIVTIFGVQYDVAPLKTGHSGGDVFICNTDMTAVYQGMHGNNVSRMVGFKVATPTPSTTPAPSATPVPSTSPTPSPSVSPKPSVTPAPSSTPIVGHDDDDDEHDDRDDLDEDKDVDDENDHHKQVKEQKSEHKESKDKSKSRSERDDD